MGAVTVVLCFFFLFGRFPTVSGFSWQDIFTNPIHIGVAAGGVVLLIVLIVIIIILFIRRCRHGGQEPPAEEASRNEETHMLRGQEATVVSISADSDDGPTQTEAEKPKAVVQPTAIVTSKQQGGRASHVYANTPEAPPQPPHEESGDETQPGASPAEPEAEPEDPSAAELHVYENDASIAVYRSFLASDPELDAVQLYLVERLSSGQLRGKFKKLTPNKDDESQAVAALPSNSKKNRFAAIVPYDVNRVVLTDGYDTNGATDFINASYIKGYNSEKVYIAAQGPRENTAVDFWRMVWQEQIIHIVMLTNLVEIGKSKCYEYWPAKDNTRTFGEFTVTGLHVDSRANFDIRTFKLKKAGNRNDRDVVHYHYTAWPDHDVPNTTSLVTFWRHVIRRSRDDSVPLLVHCSAGVGRTGTFIGLDIGMEQAMREGKVDVEKLVVQLREERCLMVQAAEQFVFLHKVLLEAYTACNTFMEVEQFGIALPDTIQAHTQHPQIDKEFKTLMQMRSLTDDLSHDFAKESENLTKNRNADMLPGDVHLVYLVEHFPGRNQYLNAVYVPTSKDPRGRILTQLPLPSTLIDFWRMVYGSDVTTIVSLASRDEENKVEPYCWYWPRSLGDREALRTGAYIIKLQSSGEISDNLTSYTVTIEKKKSPTRTVHMLRYEGWDGEVPTSTSDLLQLVDELNNTHKERHDGAVVVQCSDGVTKSGLFTAVCDVINRMTDDHEVDVYMTVRQLQTVRPQAVASVVQYRFCYEVVQYRLRDMNVYANT